MKEGISRARNVSFLERIINELRTVLLKPERMRPFGSSNETSNCTERANVSELPERLYVFPLHSNTTHHPETRLVHSKFKK